MKHKKKDKAVLKQINLARGMIERSGSGSFNMGFAIGVLDSMHWIRGGAAPLGTEKSNNDAE